MMGMYTTIVNKEGWKFQIKTGMDNMETFLIGDEVPWRINKHIAGAGHLLDGIYLATPISEEIPRPKDQFYWVIIKGHRIECIWLAKDFIQVTKSYRIPPHPREWWTEKAWKEHEEREKKFKEERDRFRAQYGHLPASEQIGILVARYVSDQMKKPSLSERILPRAAPSVSSSPTVAANFLNYYKCPDCQHEWADVWDSTCDDDCPNCGCRHIEPYESEDLRHDRGH